LNPVSEQWIETGNGKYIEASHFLKIEINQNGYSGEIDFIVGPHLIDIYAKPQEICGRVIMVETPEEILAKKVFYRAESFTARDVFDLSFLIENGMAGFVLDEPMYASKLKHIVGRIENFKANMESSFNLIDARDYRPTFDMASRTVLDFCSSYNQHKKREWKLN